MLGKSSTIELWTTLSSNQSMNQEQPTDTLSWLSEVMAMLAPSGSVLLFSGRWQGLDEPSF